MAEEKRGSSSKAQSTANQDHDSSSNGIHHIYCELESDVTARQLNGELLPENPTHWGPKHEYKVAKAKGYSHQVNGNCIGVESLKAFFGPQCYQQEIEFGPSGVRLAFKT